MCIKKSIEIKKQKNSIVKNWNFIIRLLDIINLHVQNFRSLSAIYILSKTRIVQSNIFYTIKIKHKYSSVLLCGTSLSAIFFFYLKLHENFLESIITLNSVLLSIWVYTNNVETTTDIFELFNFFKFLINFDILISCSPWDTT